MASNIFEDNVSGYQVIYNINYILMVSINLQESNNSIISKFYILWGKDPQSNSLEYALANII